MLSRWNSNFTTRCERRAAIQIKIEDLSFRFQTTNDDVDINKVQLLISGEEKEITV